MPEAVTSSSIADSAADGTRSRPAGRRTSSACSSPSRDAVAITGTGRVWATVAGTAPRLTHCTTPRRCTSSRMSAASARHSRSGSAPCEDQQVAAGDVGVAQQQLGPRQVAEDAVDDVEQGPPRAVVVERVGIEPRDHLGARRQLLDRGRRGGGSVDPAVEGRDDDGLGEHRQVAVEGVERHPWRIPRRGGQPSASSARCRFRYARTLLRLPHTSIEHHARRWLRDES